MICLYDIYEKAKGYKRPVVKLEANKCSGTKEVREYIRKMKGDNDEKITIPEN